MALRSLARLSRALAAASEPPAAAAAGRRPLHAAAPAASAGAAALAPAPARAPDAAPLPAPPAPGGDLTPRQVVEALDRHIVGQADAKRAVAIALRNRWRRHRVAPGLRDEIVPKNILMIGPTGCGKTEIARRLAKLADAPFVKVEATKFTEVGFHGRDVDQIVRDLVDAAVTQVRARLRRTHAAAVDAAVEERLLAALVGEHASPESRESFRALYREGLLDEREVELDLPPPPARPPPGAGGNDPSLQEMVIRVDRLFGARGAGRGERRRLTIAEARGAVAEAEAEKLAPADVVAREAVAAAESDGIVFIDEIDKIVTSSELRYGADASSEGVQRDLLPIIEGSVVATKHGNVSTDHVLFICSGAFHAAKPSDMLAELQGRLPIRVELKALTADDFYRILTEPEANMIKQQQALLATEGVSLHFTDAAIREVARVAAEVNAAVDSIGARRLHTVLERLVDEVSFDAPERARGSGGAATVVVDKEDVARKVGDLLKKQDLSRFIL